MRQESIVILRENIFLKVQTQMVNNQPVRLPDCKNDVLPCSQFLQGSTSLPCGQSIRGVAVFLRAFPVAAADSGYKRLTRSSGKLKKCSGVANQPAFGSSRLSWEGAVTLASWVFSRAKTSQWNNPTSTPPPSMLPSVTGTRFFSTKFSQVSRERV